MNDEQHYEQVGKFICGAYRNGAAAIDLENWMADDLGVPRLEAGDETASAKLMGLFFTKHADDGQLQENYDRFISALKNRQT